MPSLLNLFPPDFPILLPALMFGLCWGSFLNVVAHRLLCGTSPLKGRSHCPACDTTIAWYDLIPILSWLHLRGRCRTCKSPISWLYPFIELLTALVFAGIVTFVPPNYWLATLFYSSALIVTIRTDIAELTIMRQTTLFILPLAPLGAHFGLIPLSVMGSLVGIGIGSGFIALVSLVFWLLTKKVGIGQGDIELCGLIGGFTGILGFWTALMIGSILGTTVGLILLAHHPSKIICHSADCKPIKIPFGALLAGSSLLFTIFQIPLRELLTKLLLVV